MEKVLKDISEHDYNDKYIVFKLTDQYGYIRSVYK
jgi:hypothetical protein